MQNKASVRVVKFADDKLKQALDRFVMQQPEGSIYHLSSWLDACERAYQHKVYRILVEEQQQLVGYLPLTIIQPPLGKARLVATAFADYCPPLTTNSDVANLLQAALQSLIAELGLQHVELRYCAEQPLSEESLAMQLPAPQAECDSAMLSAAKVRMVVSLPEDANKLLASYKPKLRSQIKKAAKNGLVFQRATDIPALRDFYQIYCINMRRLGSPAHSLAWFAQLVSGVSGELQYFIARVYAGEQIVGAAMVLYCQHRAWIPWASTLAQFNHLAPNMLMYWEIQAFLADHGVTAFDMGRSTLGEGTFRFKQQWGAQPFLLQWRRLGLDGTTQPLGTSNKSLLRQLVETVWQKLPLSVATFVGSRIRGYIPL